MEKKKNININKGAAAIAIVFVLLFAVIFARFLYIKVTKEVSGAALTALAEENWSETRTIEAERGQLLDRNGNILAQDIPSYTLYAIVDPTYPNHVENPTDTAQKLAPILDAPAEELEEIISQANHASGQNIFQVEFGAYGRNLTQSVKEEIETLGLPGIGFTRDSRRYYPNQVFASHILGFAGKNEETNRQAGLMGLEKSLNDVLQEENGSVTYRKDKNGIKLPDPDEKMVKPKNGNNVVLTLDENVQLFVEQALDEVVGEYNPKRAIAIAVNPKTGEVLAMGNRPSFNPNERNVENYMNYAVSSRFEPGSTMKIFTLAAAVEEGVYNGQETYQSGRYHVKGGVIPDHNGGVGWGEITFNEGLERSSNVAFSILAKEKIGLNRFYQYLAKFGFHEKTGIDLPNEVGSAILTNNIEIEMVSTSFGQGSAVTPIQQVQAVTAIANDGVMMKPYVVKQIVDSEGENVLEENEPTVAGKPISPQTAETVRKLLTNVITDGTGQSFAIEGYELAGKTGTAQIPSPDGGYLDGWGNNIYSFIGMAPADDPKLVLYVAVDRPQLEYDETGSDVTSKLFTSIMKNSLQYLEIVPEKHSKDLSSSPAVDGIRVDDVIGEPLQTAREKLEQKGFRVTTFGNNDQPIEEQLPNAGEMMLAGERIILKASDEARMPDLTGWSQADVVKLAAVFDLELSTSGAGYVVEQNIKENENLRKGDYLQIELRPPSGADETIEAE